MNTFQESEIPKDPWTIPSKAFHWIADSISEGAKVIEFGSGHSTRILGRRYQLFTVEHDPDWIGKFDANYIHAPIKPNLLSTELGEVGWYDLEVVQKIDFFDAALVIIDGPTGNFGRNGFQNLFGQLLPPSACKYLIDDTNRKPEQRLVAAMEAFFGRIANSVSCAYPNQVIKQYSVFE